MPDNCMENCAVLPRVEALERDSEQHRQTHKEIFDRLRDVEKSEAVQEAALASINGKLDKLVEWQEEQRDKPGRRWDGLVEKIIWAVCGAVVAFLLAQVGL